MSKQSNLSSFLKNLSEMDHVQDDNLSVSSLTTVSAYDVQPTTSKRALAESGSDIESISELNSQPPVKKAKKEYKIFHVVSSKRLQGATAKATNPTPGVSFVFPQAEEEASERKNGLIVSHWHAVCKVSVEWVNQQRARKQKLIPNTSMCKEIVSTSYFDNTVEYIRSKLNRVWTVDEKRRLSEMRNLVPRPVRRMAGDKDYGRREQLVTEETLDTLWHHIEEDQEDISLLRRYFKCKRQLIEHEALLKRAVEERELRSPLVDRNLLVMMYDLLSFKSTFKLCQLLDVHRQRLNHPVKCGKTPIYFLIGETSCAKTKIANAFANLIGKSEFPITGYRADDNLAFSRWWETGSDVIVFDDFDFNLATRRGRENDIFSLFKQLASGEDVLLRTALNGSNSRNEINHIKRSMKAIVISINEISVEWANLANNKFEFHDRFEYIVFGPESSYDPILDPNYYKLFDDSHIVSGGNLLGLQKFGKIYLESGWTLDEGANFSRQLMSERLATYLETCDNNVKGRIAMQRAVFDEFTARMRNWPYLEGHYNQSMRRFESQQRNRRNQILLADGIQPLINGFIEGA